MKNTLKAYEILDETLNDQAYASLLMKQINDDYNMSFITQLVYGCLRDYRLVRATWSRFVKDELDPHISVLLDLGVYMLLKIENTPDYAVVNNIVEISKGIDHGKYTKLTNAVLKRVIKEDPLEFSDTLEDLSLKFSNPLWLTKLWNAHYGFETTLKLLKYQQEASELTLRVNTHKISLEDLLAKDDRFTKGPLSDDSIYYDGNIFSSSYFKEGYVSIQDAASQCVAHVVNPQKGDHILDTCSAPGTKSLHMASLVNDDLSIDAVEVYDSRARLIKDDMLRLGLSSLKVYTHDARYLEEILEEESYDKVLVDAPCTGFGVMRGKPEIKITTKPEDIDSIVVLQKEILESAAKMLKVGGDLIYSTCTVNKKENEQQIKSFLKNNENYELIMEETLFGFEHNTDSFYIAKLKKLN